MVKIAAELDRALASREAHGCPGHLAFRILAQGDGWAVQDVICTSGPQDQSFEEQHSSFTIALVLAGTFQYRAPARSAGRGGELMTPGSLLLGNAGQCFKCGHEHGTGDRCLSFSYAPEYFERLTADAGIRNSKTEFRVLCLPALRALSPLVARAQAGVSGGAQSDDRKQFGDQNTASVLTGLGWEELAVRLAAQTIQLANSLAPKLTEAPPSTVARVTRTIRIIEREHHCEARLTLASLAREAGLSPYHFLRVFEYLTGVTPHQYILRKRLRNAAVRLLSHSPKVLDVALDCGFGDVSNFNRAFRAEFGVSPRCFRLRDSGDSFAREATPFK